MAIPQSSLKLAYYDRNIVLAAESFSEASMRGVKSAFLSHSHLDAETARGVQRFLARAGWQVYIDWQDEAMPEKPNRETAARIQRQIADRDYFLFLATANSMASRWCPWELGFADIKKSPKSIYIIPTSDDFRSHGNEYLDLYQRIDLDDQKSLMAFPVGNKYIGTPLRNL
jgi:hypothetical protein